MSIAQRASLYEEHTARVTPLDAVDEALEQLTAARSHWARMPIRRRIELAEQCLEGVYTAAREWLEAACQAKGLPEGSPLRSEELAAGPLATIRYLRLLIGTLRDIDQTGSPRLPGKIEDAPGGRLKIEVVPTKGLYDAVAFAGFKAHVWTTPGVTRENLREHLATYYRQGGGEHGISAVMGAGNVSSIPCTDAFSKLFQEGKLVLLKMNPVNEYLGPIFERAFAVLIDEGLLRIVYGGADVGAHAVGHPAVDEVHITGSVYSHDTIVWGPPGEERERRKAENDPVLKKGITSELGNVTPWIVVPGPYSDKQLRFQAENLAASVTNNASFNCVATKVVLTWKGWTDRTRFLDHLEGVLAQVPPRKAYYPGAGERYVRFAGHDPQGCPTGTLPWTLVRDVESQSDTKYFNEESFVCVFVETAIEADSEEEFLTRAAEFCNERLWGTLGAGVMVHPAFRSRPGNESRFQQFIADLRYGTIGINLWPAISYALISPPWGGYPDCSLADTQSGIGWVHNTYMIDAAEKAVIEGPLTLFPKPLWFPTHRAPEPIVWKVIDLYHRPSMWKLPGIALASLRG